MRPFVGDAFDDGDAPRASSPAPTRGFGHAARAPLVQIGAERLAARAVPRADARLQGRGDAADRRSSSQASLARSGGRLTIVGATSGDTGSAAIEAFRGSAGVEVFILFPEGRVSEVQRRQMTTPAEAERARAARSRATSTTPRRGSRTCSTTTPSATRSGSPGSTRSTGRGCWRRPSTTSPPRWRSARRTGAVSFAVPTGNFGDVFAGYVAKRMGLPIDRLVVATNQNDILHRTLATGAHRARGRRALDQPVDGHRGQLELRAAALRALRPRGRRGGGADGRARRAGGFALAQGALDRLRADFDSARASEDETRAAIAATCAATGRLVCPHTAVGVHAARARRGDPATPMVTLATAHPAKFPDAVEAACGVRPALPPRLGRPARPARADHPGAERPRARIAGRHRRGSRCDDRRGAPPAERPAPRDRADAGAALRRHRASTSPPAAGTSGPSRTASPTSSSTWRSRARRPAPRRRSPRRSRTSAATSTPTPARR